MKKQHSLSHLKFLFSKYTSGVNQRTVSFQCTYWWVRGTTLVDALDDYRKSGQSQQCFLTSQYTCTKPTVPPCHLTLDNCDSLSAALDKNTVVSWYTKHLCEGLQWNQAYLRWLYFHGLPSTCLIGYLSHHMGTDYRHQQA